MLDDIKLKCVEFLKINGYYRDNFVYCIDNAYTITELLNNIVKKLNEVVNNDNNIVIIMKELIDYISKDGLKNTVNEKLNQMKINGELEEIINNSVFNKLNKNLNKLIEDFKLISNELDNTKALARDNARKIDDLKNKIESLT